MRSVIEKDLTTEETKFTERKYRVTAFAVLLALSIIVYLQFDPGHQPTGGDLSMWDYMAQAIVRGAVPYRDVVNIKTPLGSYLGAAAIVISRPFGLRDILAIRYLYILLAALTVATTFLVTDVYWRRRSVALLAAIIMLSYDSFGVWNASGSQVKTAGILFGLLSLYAVSREQALLAGFLGVLSFWCWQPGLLFTGTAGLLFCRFLTRPFDRRALAVALGALAALLPGLLFFIAHGALTDFYRWCFDFNATTNSVRALHTLAWTASRLVTVVKKSYPGEWLWFALFPVGFLWHLIETGRRWYSAGTEKFLEDSWRLAPVIAVIVYGIFCAINFQSGPDLIFLLPFVAIYTAYLLGNLADLLGHLLKRWSLQRLPIAAVIACVFLFKVADAFQYRPRFTLQDEEHEWREVAAQLTPADAVYAEGSLDLLVLYNRPNANKYIYIDRGKDVYAGKIEPGGFDGIIEDLKRKRPKFVSLAKLNRVDKQEKLLAWMAEFYEPYKEIPSTNSGINASTYPCSVYRLKSTAETVAHGQESAQY